MGYSVDILNNIRLNASEDYQNRIPVATRTNLAEIGQAFETYDVLFNEFHAALINKIGKTTLSKALEQWQADDDLKEIVKHFA